MDVSVRELKTNLSAVLRLVSEGQTATVTSHKKPVARLLPPLPAVRAQGDDIDRLLAAGVISQRGVPGPLPQRCTHTLPAGMGLLSDAVIEGRG